MGRLTRLGMSSLEAKDAIADYSGLDEGQRKVLDQWESFFEKVSLDHSPGTKPLRSLTVQRYNIVGKVVP